MLENLITQVTIRMEDAGFLKRRLFQYFMALARKVGPALLDGRPVSPIDRLLYALGNLLIYGPLKNTLGMSRVRVAYTAGEAVGPEIFNFYRALGVNMKQLYGQTEASVFVTIHPNGEVYPRHGRQAGRQGRAQDRRRRARCSIAAPACSRSISRTRRRPTTPRPADGWVHTGDAGYLDERGHLRIIDRAKDVGKLNDGTLFAPKFIENKLKFFPHINEAVAFGHGRDYVAVFVNIDMIAVGDWAERRNIAYASYQELAARQEVYDLVQGEIEQRQPRPRRRSAHGGRPDPPLPDPAQGARGRRRRAHAHQQGAPRLHRRALQASWSTRSTAAPRAPTSRSTSPSRTAARARSRATSRSAMSRRIRAPARTR